MSKQLELQPPNREHFLANLKSNGRYEYRRYNNLPLRYAGGKSLAVGYIIERIPPETQKLVSPFMGGGSVEIACAKELGMEVQGYDLFDILTNYWKNQLNKPNKLAERILKWKPTDTVYRSVKERLKQHWKEEKPINDSLELAAHYWFNHNLSYGPGFLGWMSKNLPRQRSIQTLGNEGAGFSCSETESQAGFFRAYNSEA